MASIFHPGVQRLFLAAGAEHLGGRQPSELALLLLSTVLIALAYTTCLLLFLPIGLTAIAVIAATAAFLMLLFCNAH